MKVFAVLVLLLALAGGTFMVINSSGGANAPLSLFASEDTAELTRKAQAFMEDLQFKDFKNAEKYSMPEQIKDYNIPKMLENLFKVKPEFLDINNLEVLGVNYDNSGKRARVHVQPEIKLLNTGKIQKPEVILYFKKHDDGQWYMDLASSLR